VVVKVTFLVKMTVLVVQIIMIPLWAPICLQACLVVGLHLSHQAIQAFRAVSLLNLSACPVVGRRINPPACQADSNQPTFPNLKALYASVHKFLSLFQKRRASVGRMGFQSKGGIRCIQALPLDPTP
jgi:hypothetical protein